MSNLNKGTPVRDIRISKLAALVFLSLPGVALILYSDHKIDKLIGMCLSVLLPGIALAYKRRFRVTLRTGLLMLGMLCLGFGFWATKASRQRSAVVSILQAGGAVSYERTKLIGSRVYRANTEYEPMAVSLLYPVLGDDWYYGVKSVTLYGDGCNDETLKLVIQLPTVERLALWPWAKAPSNGPSSDGPIEQSTGDVQTPKKRAGVTDDGLALLCKLPNLAHVSLSGNNISNAGLEYLKKCPKLLTFNVDVDQGSKVTQEAAAALHAAIRSRPMPVATE